MRDLAATASFIPIPNRNVIVQDVLEEVLVYDLERDIVRRLNRTAAAIWKQCDGHKNVAEIARAVAPQFEARVDEQVVLLALHGFSKVHLLAQPAPEMPGAKRVSRRELIKRLGIAALPLVTSMAVPTSAQAASCFVPGHTCSSNSQCCSNLCLPNTLGIGICS
jgi:Coenzyme PQQ synthesis protein D (PqqD)/UPF0506